MRRRAPDRAGEMVYRHLPPTWRRARTLTSGVVQTLHGALVPPAGSYRPVPSPRAIAGPPELSCTRCLPALAKFSFPLGGRNGSAGVSGTLGKLSPLPINPLVASGQREDRPPRPGLRGEKRRGMSERRSPRRFRVGEWKPASREVSEERQRVRLSARAAVTPAESLGQLPRGVRSTAPGTL